MGAHSAALARLGVALVVILAASLAWLQPWKHTPAAPAPPPMPASLVSVEPLAAGTAVLMTHPVTDETASVLAGFQTRDGGHTWRPFKAPAQSTIHFVDADHAFAASAKGLFASGDAGRTWQPRPLPAGQSFEYGQAVFLDADHGWYLELRVISGTGVPRDMYRTDDGGRSWYLVWQGTSGIPQTPVFSDPTHGFMGADQSVLRTADGGRTWEMVAAPSLDPWPRVLLAGGAVVEYSSSLTFQGNRLWTVAASTDGGSAWSPVVTVPGSGIVDVAFADARHWRAIAHYEVWRTDDGGQTWQPIAARLPPRHWLGSARFLDPDQGWALGGSGDDRYPARLLHTGDGGATWSLVGGPWS